LLLIFVPEVPVPRPPDLSLLKGVRIVARNRPFVRLVIAFLINNMANGLPATLFILFAGHALQIPDRVGPLLLVYFASGILAIPFWLRLSFRVGKHRAWACSMIWMCLVFVWMPLLGPGDFWPFAALCALAGLSLGGDLFLPASIQADVVDLDRLTSGRRRTGLFFAIWSMIDKLSKAVVVGIVFPLLDWLGFDPAGGHSSELGLTSLALLFGLAPVVIKIGAVALVWNFPIDAREQQRIRAQIDAAPPVAAGP
jgi:Na+/melibiose symporter-like transporter